MTSLQEAVIRRSATSPRVRALTVGSVALISLSAFEALAVATVMPTVAADLNGLTLYAVGFGAPLATSVVGMAVAGRWGDTRGPQLPLKAGVAVLCLGLMIAGTASSMPALVVGRAVQGLGSGSFSVSIYVLVGRVVPEDRRPRIFAFFAAAWVLPAMVGPAISGLILHAFGWRWVFLSVPALAVPALLLMLPALRADAGARAPAVQRAAPRTLLPAAGAGAGATALQIAGTRTGPAALLVAGSALAVLIWSVPRILPAGSFRLARGLPAVIAVRGLVAAAFGGAEAFLPLELVRERGWPPALAGTVLTAAALTWSAASWIQGRATTAATSFKLARTGTAVVAAGILVSVAAMAPALPAATAILGWSITGAGMGLVYPSLSLLSLHLSSEERHGEASAALQTSEALSSAVALAAAGAAFAVWLPAGMEAHAAAGWPPYVAGLSVASVAALIAVAGGLRLTPGAEKE